MQNRETNDHRQRTADSQQPRHDASESNSRHHLLNDSIGDHSNNFGKERAEKSAESSKSLVQDGKLPQLSFGDSSKSEAPGKTNPQTDRGYAGKLDSTQMPDTSDKADQHATTKAQKNETATFDKFDKAGQRDQMVTGTIKINDHDYQFRSGGHARGNLPAGEYTVNNPIWNRQDISAMKVGGVGYSFNLSDKYDPRVHDVRSALLIHPDGGSPGTSGCIGIVGNAQVQRNFREDMRQELEKNGGSFTLRVGMDKPSGHEANPPQDKTPQQNGNDSQVVAPDFRATSAPPSIRYNNPGAQYPGESANKFGSTGTHIIGGGHKIAEFPDAVSGAAAQFDLLSKGAYSQKTVGDAIDRWSGHNNSSSYKSSLANSGVDIHAKVGDVMQDKDKAIALAKAMAKVEAGREYPMSKEQWGAAYDKFKHQSDGQGPNLPVRPGNDKAPGKQGDHPGDGGSQPSHENRHGHGQEKHGHSDHHAHNHHERHSHGHRHGGHHHGVHHHGHSHRGHSSHHHWGHHHHSRRHHPYG